MSWDSDFFSLPPVHADLRPVQAGGPPIWIGGASEAAMRRVGRSATGWLGLEYLPDETAFFVREAALARFLAVTARQLNRCEETCNAQ